MKAMILAAGFGTRLKPLTNKRPKALIEIQNIPLLELVIKKLIAAGVSEIIINTHHLTEQIVNFIQKKDSFGIHIEFSHEQEILGTGGGLKKASYFFDDDQPFFLYNVDILSTINLTQIYRYHFEKGAMVTLAIQQRETSRYFIVDEANNVCGHEDLDNRRTRLMSKPVGNSRLMAFCGIHVISPKLFDYIEEKGRFSIVDTYLRLIEHGISIIGFPADGFYWKDVGKLAALNELKYDINKGNVEFESLVSILASNASNLPIQF
jgi:NDP-sugar pyrophosphorylase family protein